VSYVLINYYSSYAHKQTLALVGGRNKDRWLHLLQWFMPIRFSA